MLIAQISDLHIRPPGQKMLDRVDTACHLERAVAHILALDPRPDLVLATGDARLDWPQRKLGESGRPTILFMHHPPFACGLVGMDRVDALVTHLFYVGDFDGPYPFS